MIISIKAAEYYVASLVTVLTVYSRHFEVSLSVTHRFLRVQSVLAGGFSDES